jgi:penicillin-binding protein 1C
MRFPRRRTLGVTALTVACSVGLVRFGPLPAGVASPARVGEYVIVDRNGRPLTDDVSLSSTSAGMLLAQRSPKLAAATIAAEDRRFASHSGVDVRSTGRAVVANVRARRVVQGGSTITQQLVETRRNDRRPGVIGKMRSAVYSLRLEHRRSKDEILSAYLAEVPYGAGVIGAPAAADRYFAKPVSQLTWGEAALLAALPQRPTRFDPVRHPGAAEARRQRILRDLHRSGALTSAELTDALRPIRVVQPPVGSPQPAAHLTRRIERALERSGVRGSTVRTTLDARLQRDVEGAIAAARPGMAKVGAHNAAVIVIDNRSGDVLAWEGSGDFFDTDHGGMIDGVLTPRQGGSTVKPFIYALAFEHGAAPGDLVRDAPIEIQEVGRAFAPLNYDYSFRGTITMREALGSSVNIPAVRTLRTYGPDKLGGLMTDAGINFPQDPSTYGLTLGLGAAETDLFSLTRAAASFARGGKTLSVRVLRDATPDVEAALGLPADPRAERVVSAATAFLVTDVLRDNEARAPSFGRQSNLRFDFPVAAKTGTSQGFHDNWVIGWTDDVTVGVWVGNFDRTPLEGATGVTGAGPIFHAVMQAAHDRMGTRGALRQHTPDSMPAGLRAEQSRAADQGWEYRWGSQAPLGRDQVAVRSERADRLALAQPSSGSAWLIDRSVPLTAQGIPMRATGGRGPYRFEVNGTVVRRVEAPGGSTGDAPLSGPVWPLQQGRHQACVIDADGARRCASFTVR